MRTVVSIIVELIATILGRKATLPAPVATDTAVPVMIPCGCGTPIVAGTAVCEACLEDSVLVVPSACKGCGKKDYKECLDFCFECEVDGTEDRLRSTHDPVDKWLKEVDTSDDGLPF